MTTPPVGDGEGAGFGAWLAGLRPRGLEGARIARNVGWLIGDRVFRLAVGLAINVWMIRVLGAANVGLMSFSQSLVALGALLTYLGLDSIVVRELVRRPEQAGEVLGSAFGLRAAGAIATLLVSAAAMLIARPGESQALAMAAIFASGSAAQSLDVIEHWFQSRSVVAPFVSARAVAFVLASVAKVACLATGAPLPILAAAIAGEYVLAAIGLSIAYRVTGESFARWRFVGARARTLLSASWPLLISSFAVVVYTRTDQVMLTLMRGDAENGIYAAAQRLSEILYFVPVAVMAAANPALLRAHQEGRSAYESRLGRVFGLLLWSAVLLALPISLLSGWIVTTLFGPEFRASGPVLALHVWAAPAVFLGVAQATWFVAEGRERALLSRTLAGALLNVALNAILIPRLGAVGSAAATLVAQWVASLGLNAMFPSTRRLFRLQGRAMLAPVRR
jgi:polysaccharide transporter, PST family